MKKLLSIALALIMLLSVFAFSASAVSYKTETVTTNWHLGYVGSSTNSGSPNKINPSGGSYSYTDIIDMGPAGSTISFSDDIAGFSSAAAYTISFWKKSGEEYVLDTDAANKPGGGEKAQITYSFTTTEENQGIRVCYRSEQTASFVPVYEDVYVDGVKVDVTWNFGFTKPDGSINPTGGQYSHTDVFTVAKKGSVVTFTDTNKDGSAFASSGAAVFTTWKKEGEAWVYGGTSVDGATAQNAGKSNSVTYTYTSTKDNELVRLCYRSEETTTNVPATRPVVTLKSPVIEEKPPMGDSSALLIFAVIGTVAFAGVSLKKSSRS